MTRRRLRPAYPPEELARVYSTPHAHSGWQDHRLRVAVTIEVARMVAESIGAKSAADLSCGDGAVLKAMPVPVRFFGDFAPGYERTGPIEETLEAIPNVDMFVCTETLEHLDDPDKVLAGIRGKTRTLVLSTPVAAWMDTNPEHYWAWSRTDVEEMLLDAGFTSAVYSTVDFRPSGQDFYQFGIWGCQ